MIREHPHDLKSGSLGGGVGAKGILGRFLWGLGQKMCASLCKLYIFRYKSRLGTSEGGVKTLTLRESPVPPCHCEGGKACGIPNLVIPFKL